MLNIIVNPRAGKNKAGKALEKIEKKLKKLYVDYIVHKTERKGHATEIASELTSEKDADIVVIGGDGTFHEVVCGIKCFDGLRLGLIPCGTGNDFARMIPLPNDPLEALDIVLNKTVKAVDYIQFNDGRRSINVAGAGMDVDTLEKYEQVKRIKGKMKYYYALFSVIAEYKCHKLKLILDDKEYEREAFIIAIANGKFIGGGMPISPLSDIDDGMLNVVIVNKIPRFRLMPLLMSFLKGKHITKSGVEQYYVRKARLEVLDDGKVQLDGEIFDDKVLDCEVVSGKLHMFYPYD